MPLSGEAITQFIVGTVLPPLIGVLADLIVVKLHFLALFHITSDSLAKAITEVSVWGVTTVVSWLTAHHILRGHYTPAAKATSK